MAQGSLPGKFNAGRLRHLTLLLILLIFCACSAKKPPLSPAAANFKEEVQGCIQRLAGTLGGPVARLDTPAVNQALGASESAVKLCRSCPFQIGVADLQGDSLGRYPEKKDGGFNFSGYDLFAQVLKSRRISQKRFFLQGGSEIYIIAAPIFSGGRLVGLLGVSLDAEEALHRWGLTDEEFLALDFNN